MLIRAWISIGVKIFIKSFSYEELYEWEVRNEAVTVKDVVIFCPMKNLAVEVTVYICVKSVKIEGILINTESNSDYDRNLNLLSKAIRNCMIVFMEHESFLLFEYQNYIYIIGDELNSEIYVYQGNKEQKFLVSEKLQKSELLMEVLSRKYYNTMDSNQSFDYEELIYDKYVELSKKRKQYLEVILSIHQLK